jgi:hypothetical protein
MWEKPLILWLREPDSSCAEYICFTISYSSSTVCFATITFGRQHLMTSCVSEACLLICPKMDWWCHRDHRTNFQILPNISFEVTERWHPFAYPCTTSSLNVLTAVSHWEVDLFHAIIVGDPFVASVLKDEIADSESSRSLSVLPAFGSQVRKPARQNQPAASKRSLSWAQIVSKWRCGMKPLFLRNLN